MMYHKSPFGVYFTNTLMQNYGDPYASAYGDIRQMWRVFIFTNDIKTQTIVIYNVILTNYC